MSKIKKDCGCQITENRKYVRGYDSLDEEVYEIKVEPCKNDYNKRIALEIRELEDIIKAKRNENFIPNFYLDSRFTNHTKLSTYIDWKRSNPIG